MEFVHKSVMLDECITALNIIPNGVYIDGTLGGAGHSFQIAQQLNKDGILIMFDLDQEAIDFAKNKLANVQCKLIFAHDNFKNFLSVLAQNNISKVNGILLDLGVSSYQIDNAERGFSYMLDGELNMAMDKNAEKNAQFIVNNYSESDLASIFYKYGEEKFARNIAKNIVIMRKISPITTTAQLVEAVLKGIPFKAQRESKGHPAKKVFQALRIEVNGELDKLAECLEDMGTILASQGRLAVITFHSLEDRIVKEAFNLLATDCICDKRLPICVCHHKSLVKLINRKPILPSETEINENSRAHSAKLRIVEKL